MRRLCAACLVAAALFWVSPAARGRPRGAREATSRSSRSMRSSTQKKPVTFIDVRPKDQFDDLHIRGAKHIPLTELPRRLASVSKTGLPGPLLSVPARVGPGGLQGAVRRGISQHGDPRRGPSGLGAKNSRYPHGRRADALTAELSRRADERRSVRARRPRGARCALARLAQPGMREAEVFAAANRSLVTRLNYTSHIPCNGVEEPKSTEMLGARAAGRIRVRAGRRAPRRLRRRAERLRRGRRPARARQGEEKRRRRSGVPLAAAPHRRARGCSPTTTIPDSVAVDDEQLVEAGWKVVAGALGAFTASSRLAELAGTEADLARLGLILRRRRDHPAGVAWPSPPPTCPGSQTDESAT